MGAEPNSAVEQKVEFVVRSVFDSRFGAALGARLSSKFLRDGRDAVLQALADSRSMYLALAREVLARNGLAVDQLRAVASRPDIEERLSIRQERCKHRVDSLRVTVPYLRGTRERDDMLLLTNDAYIVVEEVEVYALGRMLEKLRQPRKSTA